MVEECSLLLHASDRDTKTRLEIQPETNFGEIVKESFGSGLVEDIGIDLAARNEKSSSSGRNCKAPT